MVERPAAVLALSGLESSGRVGLLADVETFRALGARPFGVATALTAQGERAFEARALPVKLVLRQMEAAFELSPIDAVKLGIVPSRALLRALWRELSPLPVQLVVDPVVRSSRGESLSSLSLGDYWELAERAVITPNLEEAQELLGLPRPIRSLEEAKQAARALCARGFKGAVLKGGHRRGPPADVVCPGAELTVLSGSRLRSAGTPRGTGCRFASALAVGLGEGRALVEAAQGAKVYVRDYLRTPA